MKAKHRFFIKDFVKADVLSLENQEIVHQCNKVLRLKSEDFVAVFNWEDNSDYTYQISEITKKSIQLQYIDEYKKNISNTQIHIYQALPNKLSKLEFIVQKCSEVWVTKITFFKSQYSQQAKFLSANKIERLRKIAIESAEQSHRNTILKLEFIQNIPFETINFKQAFCLHTKNNNSEKLKNLDINIKEAILLFVWPEWWFHHDEIEQLQTHWAQCVHLWDNILRTESVGFWVSFFIIQNFFNT